MAATTSSYHLLNNILRPRSSSFRCFLFRRPFNLKFSSSISTSTPPLNLPLITTTSTPPRPNFRPQSVISTSLDVLVEQEVIEDEEEEEDGEFEDEDDEVLKEEVKLVVVDRSKLPKLTIKEKKELASYAHSLGKKLKVQLVGKSGVTASLANSFVETLEANELLKIKIHATCPGEVPGVAKQLEDSTGSVVVGQIGRTVILYRPSLSKMKAEEKRRQERKVFVRKDSVFKPAFPKKEGIPRPTETYRPNRRGTRGSSRLTAE